MYTVYSYAHKCMYVCLYVKELIYVLVTTVALRFLDQTQPANNNWRGHLCAHMCVCVCVCVTYVYA